MSAVQYEIKKAIDPLAVQHAISTLKRPAQLQ